MSALRNILAIVTSGTISIAHAGFGGMGNVDEYESSGSGGNLLAGVLVFGAAWIFIKNTKFGREIEDNFGAIPTLIGVGFAFAATIGILRSIF